MKEIRPLGTTLALVSLCAMLRYVNLLEDDLLLDGLNDLLRFIDELKDIQILRGDLSFLQNHLFHPVEKSFPVIRPKQDHGKGLILRVWMSVTDSMSSSIVPKPPGE